MFNMVDYFTSLSESIKEQSNLIAKSFNFHHLSSGQNKENLVADMLKKFLPPRFEVGSGFLVDREGGVSNESDLLIADGLNNTPFFKDSDKPIWFAESVYAVVEVKSTLSSEELDNCLKKCRHFKKMKRKFDDLLQLKARIED